MTLHPSSSARSASLAARAQVDRGIHVMPRMIGRESRSARLWLRRLIIVAGVVVSLVTLCLVAGFFWFAHSVARTETPLLGKADAVVALTGGAQRIGDAVDLLSQGAGRRLLITGVHPTATRDSLSRTMPSGQRLFGCCVDLDYMARNTIGNAIEIRRWMNAHGFRSAVVVTSNYHMPRTLLELSSAMPQARFTPYPVVTPQTDPSRWWYDVGTARLLLSEYAKYLACRARKTFEGDPEGSWLAQVMSGRRPTFAWPSQNPYDNT